MKRLKLFLSNFIIYGLSGAFSKLVPLIMLPIVTRIMTNTYYFGLNDLSTSFVSFGSAVAIMGMYDAMFRLFFDKDDEQFKKDICSSALAFTLMTSIIVFSILLIFKHQFSRLFFDSPHYTNLVFFTALSILVGSTDSIIAAPTRMQNKRTIYLITNTLSPIISYTVSIPLLLRGMYVIALPLSSVLAAVSKLVIFSALNKKWFSIKNINTLYIKHMLKIALPLLPNFLVYWVFNSCDRLMISKLLGTEYTGIYAVGAKVGQISNLIYIAFAGGWQYFAFSTMKDDDQVQMTSNIFEYLGVISLSAGVVMAVCSKAIFKIIFTGDYVAGYIVAPYLFLAPLLQMLFQIISNQLLIIKKTWPNLIILSGGAILNILINFILIPLIGIEGAAIATLFGYACSLFVGTVVISKMYLIMVSNKFFIAVILTFIYFVAWRLFFKDLFILSMLITLVLLSAYFFLYREDLNAFINKFKKKGAK